MKRYENNVQRVYGVCVKNPLGNDLTECLLYPPSLAIPEECISIKDDEMPYIAQLLQSNHFSNAAGSRIIANLKPEVRDSVYCILGSMLYLKRTKATPTPGGGGTPYNGLYGEAPPERGTFFRLQVYKRVGISQVEVYKRVGKSVI